MRLAQEGRLLNCKMSGMPRIPILTLALTFKCGKLGEVTLGDGDSIMTDHCTSTSLLHESCLLLDGETWGTIWVGVTPPALSNKVCVIQSKSACSSKIKSWMAVAQTTVQSMFSRLKLHMHHRLHIVCLWVALCLFKKE